jgi:hypothetical protein
MEAYKLWRERNPMTRTNIDAKTLLIQQNYMLKAKRITAVEIDGITENIRLKIKDDTEEHKRNEWRHNGYNCKRAPEEIPRK